MICFEPSIWVHKLNLIWIHRRLWGYTSVIPSRIMNDDTNVFRLPAINNTLESDGKTSSNVPSMIIFASRILHTSIATSQGVIRNSGNDDKWWCDDGQEADSWSEAGGLGGGSSEFQVLFRVPGVVGWGHSFARRLDVLKKIVYWNKLQNKLFCLIYLSFLSFWPLFWDGEAGRTEKKGQLRQGHGIQRDFINWIRKS